MNSSLRVFKWKGKNLAAFNCTGILKTKIEIKGDEEIKKGGEMA